MQTPKPKILPVILSYSERRFLPDLIARLEGEGETPGKVIVANTGEDALDAGLLGSGNVVEWRWPSKQWTANWNEVAKRVKPIVKKENYTHVWFLSDDVVLPVEICDHVVWGLGIAEGVFGPVGQYTLAFNSPWPHCQPAREAQGIAEVPWLEPTAAIYSVEALNKVFPAGEGHFALGWGLEYWIAWHLQKHGLKRVVDSNTMMYHHTSATNNALYGKGEYRRLASEECTRGIKATLPGTWWQDIGCEANPWPLAQ